jgi:hypothetical protein
MDVIESTGYHRLVLMYKGEITAETLREETLKQGVSAASHSVMYGLGNWYLYNNKRTEALALFRQIVSSDQWTSFGYIAAVADLKMLQTRANVRHTSVCRCEAEDSSNIAARPSRLTTTN